MISDEEYVCGLSRSSQKKAVSELNEDPTTRLASVQGLREWIQQQEHITFNTDIRILLRFLRTAKYSQLAARQQIQRYLLAVKSMPEWCCDIDTYCPKLLALLKTGFLTDLGEDDEHRRNFLFCIGRIDPCSTLYDDNDLVRLTMALLYSLMYDEYSQVHGVVLLVDNSGYTQGHQRFLCIDTIRKGSRMFQSTFPGRWKKFHYFNAGSIFENLYKIIKPMLKKKIRDRVSFHTSISSICKHVPHHIIPREFLPPDVQTTAAGRRAHTIQQLNDELFERLTAADVREQVLMLSSSTRFSIDVTTRPAQQDEAAMYYRKLVDT